MRASIESLRCVAYSRASCTGRTDDQRQAYLDFLKQHGDVLPNNLSAVYVGDPSDQTAENPSALDRLLTDAQVGQFNLLLVSSGTRLSRDLQVLTELLLKFVELDVTVVFVDEMFCTDPLLHTKLFTENGSSSA